MTNLHHLSAVELSAKIKSKEVSSLELTELYISRIEKLDDKVNSVVVRTFDQAIEDAKKSGPGYIKRRRLRSFARSADDHQRVVRSQRSKNNLGNAGVQG